MYSSSGVSQPARAQSEIFDDLLEKLRDKGVLSDAEYDALKQARDKERTEQRAERRKQALKEAQATEKEEKGKEEDKTALKGRFRNGFTWETGDKSAMIGLAGIAPTMYYRTRATATAAPAVPVTVVPAPAELAAPVAVSGQPVRLRVPAIGRSFRRSRRGAMPQSTTV